MSVNFIPNNEGHLSIEGLDKICTWTPNTKKYSISMGSFLLSTSHIIKSLVKIISLNLVIFITVLQSDLCS